MGLYYETTRLVSEPPEKGTAVAVSEHLISKYSDAIGYSPRNLYRMRDFYRAYQGKGTVLRDALQLGWTQNVAILEAELSMEARHWYIRAAKYFKWSKAELLQQIQEHAHEKMTFDKTGPEWYIQNKKREVEYKRIEDTFCLSRKHLPQPHGGICDERSGANDWLKEVIPD